MSSLMSLSCSNFASICRLFSFCHCLNSYTLPFGKKYKNSRLNLALYWLMKQHEDVLPDTFFEKTPDYCAKFKLPILGVMQKILDEQAAAITAWLRKYLARRATTAVVANS